MSDRFVIGEQADPVKELKRLLDYNEFIYDQDGESFTLVFSDRGYKWETCFECLDDAVIIFGIYPFEVSDMTKASVFCGEVNAQSLFGAMLLDTEMQRIIYRTCADMFDAYSAYEQIGRMLEYNADIITHFWDSAKEAAGNA